MGVAVACDRCGKQYDALESLIGRQVRCAQCGEMFVAHPLGASGPASGFAGGGHPSFAQAAYSPSGPSAPEGPTDQQYRLGGAIMVPIMILGMLAAIFGGQGGSLGAVTLIGLGPLFLLYACAAIIDPNLVRGATKFGTHLPTRYKVYSFLIGLVGVAIGVPLVLFLAFRE